MKDQAAWEQAVTACSGRYFGLLPGTRAELDVLLEEIMQFKQDLVELVTSSGSSEICRSCGGECCRLGRYHVRVLDILAYRKTGVEPLIPHFTASPACPYSDAAGCLMSACYRPLTCVIFNCQLIEDRLSATERFSLLGFESMLRATVANAVRIHGTWIARPLLLSCS